MHSLQTRENDVSACPAADVAVAAEEEQFDVHPSTLESSVPLVLLYSLAHESIVSIENTRAQGHQLAGIYT